MSISKFENNRPSRHVLMCAQMSNSTDQEVNVVNILQLLDSAASHQAHVVLFPECALTGFHSQPGACTYDDLEPLIERIHDKTRALGMSVVLPSIVQREDGAMLNSGWFLGADGGRSSFAKRGLTPSEERFFTAPDEALSRVFYHQQLRLGLIVCREIADGSDAYLDALDVDIILWPTYWHWDEDMVWGDAQGGPLAQAAHDAVSRWRVPLCQANYANNDADDPRQSGPSGASVVISSTNQHLISGARHEVGLVRVVVDVERAMITSTDWISRP